MAATGQSTAGAEVLSPKTTAQAPAAAAAKALRAISLEVQALTRDIIAAEQEADVLRFKCAQLSAEESNWRSMSREAPYTSPAGTLRDVRERLLAAQQDLNDTTVAYEAEAHRLREASTQAREELEASDRQEAAAARECADWRSELQEASRALAFERAREKELADTCLALSRAEEAKLGLAGEALEGGAPAREAALGGVAGQKARSQALFELAAERRAAVAAESELRGCEEALSEVRQRKEAQLAPAQGSEGVDAEILQGPAALRLEAADAEYQLSCSRSEELLRKVETWRGLTSSSQARAEAAEGKAQRAAQRRAAAEAAAAEQRGRLEAAKPRLEAALEEKQMAKSGLQASRRRLQAASAALALAVSFATARAIASAGIFGS